MNIKSLSQNKWRYFLSALLLLCITVGVNNYFQAKAPTGNLKEQTFSSLNKIRKAKKREVIAYFDEITSLADSIGTDPAMLNYFTAIKQATNNQELEYEIDKHYVITYGNFYDILFVDPHGYVFHSIKKEADYHTNLLKSELAHSGLAQTLRSSDKVKFTDFDYYSPSDETAAFFPVPVTEDGQHRGWLILQCDVNNINNILTDRQGMGRTGEIYLVNKQKLMLSDSRFLEDSTILRQKVDTLAVKESFQHKTGNKIIEDYRGITVFSSYESFDVLGSTWGIIAEIDEDEIITEHYKKYKNYFKNELINYLAARPVKATNDSGPMSSKSKRVDMNEFSKAKGDSVLTTYGVASCTAVSITYPDKFVYLAHISPTDEIYLKNPLTKFVLRKNYHNFVSELLAKIKFYEIYPYELKNLQFVITAPHINSYAKAIDSILSHGVELANIKFVYNPTARNANIISSATGSTWVQWNQEQNRAFTINIAQLNDLGTIVKKIIRYDS